MSLSLLALGLSIVTLLCAVGTTIAARERARIAYREGLADALAAACGTIAAEQGFDAPVLDRIIARVGELAQDRQPS